MLSSLSSGVSGLDSFQEEMNVIGNNIANINTTAFKAGVVNFADAFSNTLNGGSSSTPPLQVGTGVDIASITNNWANGGLTSNGVPSNLAISGNGNGFFTVVDPTTTPPTTYVTQDGTFGVNAAGNLVTSNGDIVQGYTDGTLSTIGNITIQPSPGLQLASYTIDSTGTITVTNSDGSTAVVGQVLLQDFNDPQMLTSQGNNLYGNLTAASPTTSTLVAPGTNGLGGIQSGALESSNVDLSNEMANLITAQQAFDANSKMITTSNEVLQTVVNMKQS